MEENKKDSPEENPKDTPPPVTIKEEIKDGNTEKETAKHHTNERNDFSNIPQPFSVKIDTDKTWKRQDLIALASTLATILLFIIAFRAFIQTRKSVKDTENQIQQQQEQFIKTNSPYLEVIVDSINKIDTSNIEINYGVINISETPVQILDCVYDYFVDTAIDSINEEDANSICDSLKRKNSFLKGTYLLRGAPTIFSQFKLMPEPPFKIFPKIYLDSITYYDDNYLYIADQIIYKNLVSGKKRYFRCIIKLKPSAYKRPEFTQYLFMKNGDSDELKKRIERKKK